MVDRTRHAWKNGYPTSQEKNQIEKFACSKPLTLAVRDEFYYKISSFSGLITNVITN